MTLDINNISKHRQVNLVPRDAGTSVAQGVQ